MVERRPHTRNEKGPSSRRSGNVQTISASAGAFAAVLGDGSLVVWGDPHQGGDRALELTDVREVVGAQKVHRRKGGCWWYFGLDKGPSTESDGTPESTSKELRGVVNLRMWELLICSIMHCSSFKYVDRCKDLTPEHQ